MSSQRLKFGLGFLLVWIFCAYSFGANALSWQNELESMHLHLLSYSDNNPGQADHDHRDLDHSHSHSHRHGPDSPVHEHSHPDPAALQWASFVLPQFLAVSLSFSPDISNDLPLFYEQILSNPLLHSIFRPPISKA